MKILIIPDIHGRDLWIDIVTKENADKIIFLGDYFDSGKWDDNLKKVVSDIQGNIQLENFINICEFKKESEKLGKEVILLIGNHDFHYFPNLNYFTCTSGYQHDFAFSIGNTVYENNSLLSMCHLHDNFLFSHAGISYDWLKKMKYDNEPLDEFVNEMWKYKPLNFAFNGRNSYGDDVYQTPIWIRPRSLMKSNRYRFLKNKYIQIVGHTGQDNIDIKGKATGGRYYFTDTFGTSKEYLTIIDNEIILNKFTNNE